MPAFQPSRLLPLELWCDAFPVVSETFVVGEARELSALGHPLSVCARHRPEHPAVDAGDVPVRYAEDEPRGRRAFALATVVLCHPVRCLADLLARRRWRREEHPTPLRQLAPALVRLMRAPQTRVHVHFAGPAALDAMRAGRILGRPWSLTAHAYDIYRTPRNLREKLRGATLVTSGCDYTVRDLKALAGPEHAERIHRVVMGVDAERFRRTGLPDEPPAVLAVGRLVEKKGFLHLIRAVADPALAGALARLEIVGDGPLRAELTAEVERLGLSGVVELVGRREASEVRVALERAAVLVMPCVVAADGDRDSMPVVVKEALAMELPVVVSDEVGLPELARPEFARLVPPGDPRALAAALSELLSRTPQERAAMGRAGRAFVTEHANLRRETARLSDLLRHALGG
ncbi:MAG: glycosyltransferase [Solirubrobacterales bacterium]|nr:glycosyltransferase [Solirubrobacterales bacterium]